MCSIIGFTKTRYSVLSSSSDRFGKLMLQILEQGFERGRDGFGYAGFTGDTALVTSAKLIPGKETVREQFNDPAFQQDLLSAIATKQTLICNHRAEPTNEYLPEKQLSDQQPYGFNNPEGRVFAVHNGTIANDKALYAKHPQWLKKRDSVIDSAIIPMAFAEYQSVQKVLQGSMAVAVFHAKYGQLVLYRNYQPLYLFRSPDDTFLFSSVRAVRELLGSEWRQIPFPPYTQISPQRNGTMNAFRDFRKDSGRSIVICSGGLDSTTVAAEAANDKDCTELTLLHFLYRCKAEQREVDAVLAIAQALQTRHPNKTIRTEFVDMTWLGKLGGSSLTDSHKKIEHSMAGVEFAHEWVPARNTAMIGMTAAYADRYNVDRIYLGLNLEESGAYPDNTVEFFEEFNHVLDVGTQARPVIVNPLAGMMKHEIVAHARAIEAPIDLAWSCYEGRRLHCGTCGPCIMRRTAFKMNGLADNLQYEV